MLNSNLIVQCDTDENDTIRVDYCDLGNNIWIEAHTAVALHDPNKVWLLAAKLTEMADEMELRSEDET